VTDYDCWHEGHDAVSVETVVEYLNKNVRNAQVIMREAVKELSGRPRRCKCDSALKNAIFTAPDIWPEATKKKLDAIISKYNVEL
jgi:5'-methylthioadenosine phosphorylase